MTAENSTMHPTPEIFDVDKAMSWYRTAKNCDGEKAARVRWDREINIIRKRKEVIKQLYQTNPCNQK